MKIITSQDNLIIKKLRSLSVKKYREQFGLCLLEGKKMVLEALNHEGLVQNLIISKSEEDAYCDLVKNYETITIIVADEVYKTLSFAVSPQSIMAVIKINDEKPIDLTKNLVVLDHLQDPGNLGSIIRSSVASGHTEFVLINSVDPYNEKTLRSATGTIFKANFHFLKPTEFIDFAKSQKLNLIVADMDGEDVFSDTLSIQSPYALVIGSEGQGVSKEILDLPHKTVAILMENNVESLNASVSASIIMFNLKNKTK